MRSQLLPLFCIVFLDMLGVTIIIPIVTPFILQADLGIAPEWRTVLLGFLLAAYPFAQLFGAPWLGALSDRYGRKPVLILSLIGTMVGYALLAWGMMIANIPLLFLSRFLSGVTGGNISVALSAIADMSDEKSKPKNFGLIGMAFGFGFIIGPFIGGKLADANVVSWFNYATPVWFSTALSIVNILLIMVLFKETLFTRHLASMSLFTGFRNVVRAFQLETTRIMFVVILLMTLGFNFFTQSFPIFLIDKFNFTASMMGNVFAFVGVWIGLTQGVLIRPLSKRFSPSAMLRVSGIGLAIVLGLIALTTAKTMYGVLPFIAIFEGLAMTTSTAIISNLATKDSQGEIMGINQSIQSFAMMVPPLISGFIAIIDVRFALLSASLLTLIGSLLFIFWFKPSEQKKFHEV